MKGLILSGGKGSRLRPFTYTGAKQLVPLANKPVLFYGIEQLVEAGITEIGIIVGDTGDQIRAAVGDGSAFGASIECITQEAPRGLADGVLTGEAFLDGNPFVLMLGDNFLVGGITPYTETFDESCSAQILLKRVADPTGLGVAVVEHEQVKRLVEKPQEFVSDLAVIGIYMFDSSIFTAARSIQPSARGELEITDAIQSLLDSGKKVRAATVEGRWIDTGKFDDLLEANEVALASLSRRLDGEIDAQSFVNGPVVLESGARVVQSVINGPAIIGRDTLVESSIVGPSTSIHDRCVLRNVVVNRSIVMQDSTLEECDRPFNESIIGRFVHLRGGSESYALQLGDHSQGRLP
ncbi:MAG: glucose-1-phosphate thymidylyltransferase [Dehalococcoidia bacterium]